MTTASERASKGGISYNRERVYARHWWWQQTKNPGKDRQWLKKRYESYSEYLADQKSEPIDETDREEYRPAQFDEFPDQWIKNIESMEYL
jgi:hypothetical protein